MSTASDVPVPNRSWVEIDLHGLRANVRSLSALLSPDRSLMAVMKADAYGHGLLPAARAALQGGASWLGVATVTEGVTLRRARIPAAIAVLCMPDLHEASSIVANALTPVVGDFALADALAAVRGKADLKVHLEIDTGMGRSGALPENAVKLWQYCMLRGLEVNGLCTHFADADGRDPTLTLQQWKRFSETRRILEAAGAKFDWIHAGNSAAVLRFPANECNLVRPGLLIYGIRPVISTLGDSLAVGQDEARIGAWDSHGSGAVSVTVRPVLTLKARIGAIRELPAGHTISYGATCRLTRPSRAATVLIGYGDGYPRRLSNCGEMLVRGRRAPILGRVCMDQTVIDVTDHHDIAPGDTVTCIGMDGNESISAESIAHRIETTEHEITTCLTARLPRVFIMGEFPVPGA